jgi:hypothetical protein
MDPSGIGNTLYDRRPLLPGLLIYSCLPAQGCIKRTGARKALIPLPFIRIAKEQTSGRTDCGVFRTLFGDLVLDWTTKDLQEPIMLEMPLPDQKRRLHVPFVSNDAFMPHYQIR